MIIFLLRENQFRFFKEFPIIQRRESTILVGIIITTSKKNNYIVFVFSFLLFITLPGGKRNCLHAKSRYKIGKSTLYIITSKSEMPTLAGKIQLFQPSLPSKDAHFPSFDRKWPVLIRRRWTSKCFFPRRHLVYSLGITNFLHWERIMK